MSKKIKLTDMIYIASLLDSRGQISIEKAYSTTYGTCYRLTVTINHRDLSSLEKIRSKFGGHITKPKTSNVYVLHFTGKKCKRLLTTLLPSLRIKTKQARIALKYIATIQNTGTKKLSKACAKRRLYLMSKMQQLNVKGD